MISQTVEYALRAVVYLADQGDSPCTTGQIAEATKVPPAYLSKVLQNLGRAQLVHAQRGLHGGFTLSKPPAELTIWDVVQAVEPLQRIRTCPLELAAHRLRLCPLHKRLDDALALIERAFRDTTVAEILAEPSTSKPLCAFPRHEM
ncbi:MAG: Rrf2 family transcriptional regulator [Gemmataceae bacterium]|nr:Rrf2 family transcriptional regulator [Gemmataceae bacterium]